MTLDHASVRATNSSPLVNTYKLFDNVCNRVMPDLRLGPYASAIVWFSSSEEPNDGYGSFRSQIAENGMWNNFELI